MDLLGEVLALIVGFGGGVFWSPRRAAPEQREVEPVEVSEAPSRERFLLTWKRGRIETSNMMEVSLQIQDLRASGQPYEYYMDGRKIHPKE